MDDPVRDAALRVVFIGGTGRSGTNVSKDLLARHGQVATLPFEYRFIVDPDGLADFYRSYASTWTPYLADRRLKRLEAFLSTLAAEPLHHGLAGQVLRWLNRDGKTLSPRQYHGWNLDAHLPGYSQAVDRLMAELLEFTFAACWAGTDSYTFRPCLYYSGPKPESELAQILGGFIRSVLGNFLARQNKEVYVEDNTWNILLARELLDLVPEAKIVHVYRDPRDVVASFTKQRWSPADPRQAALWYRSIIRHWFAVRDTLPPDAYLEYSLESLVQDTESVARALCRFIGVPYSPSLLEVDLSRSHRGRWRKDLSAADQRQVQDILEDLVEQLGYD